MVNLPRAGLNDGRCDHESESSRRISGNFGEFVPSNESGCELFAIGVSFQSIMSISEPSDSTYPTVQISGTTSPRQRMGSP